ncbi:hypothetical protein DL96DRAFT_1558625 [Flagelloscypha sp. PMI_526]|nr:hypothetical protein DL96DRAFT_1558625 [Flagelloscypha sp. PMI_526]
MAVEPSLSVLDLIQDGVFHIFRTCHLFELWKVEDTLFRLPTQHFCQHIRFFETLLSLPVQKPSTNEDPIQIYDTTVDTFVFVLEWLYRLPQSQLLDKEGWIKIFRFSQAYQAEELQKEALDKLKTFEWTPTDQLNFCERYNVDYSWSASSLAKLASRWAPLTEEEEMSLELRTFGLIMKLREIARERTWWCQNGTVQSWPPLLNFTPTDVISYLEVQKRGHMLALESKKSQGREAEVVVPDSSERVVENWSEEQVSSKFHERFYLSDEIIHISSDTMSLNVHAGVLAIHSPTLVTKRSDNWERLLLSSIAFRCLRWMYREISISNSPTEEWIEILRFSHSISVPHLKAHAISALAEPTPLEVLERIRLCEECQIPLTWAEQVIGEISMREDALDPREFQGLSGVTLLFLMGFREKALKERSEKANKELEEQTAKAEDLRRDLEEKAAQIQKFDGDLKTEKSNALQLKSRVKQLETDLEKTKTPANQTLEEEHAEGMKLREEIVELKKTMAALNAQIKGTVPRGKEKD